MDVITVMLAFALLASEVPLPAITERQETLREE
jgi:hypothetical protein